MMIFCLIDAIMLVKKEATKLVVESTDEVNQGPGFKFVKRTEQVIVKGHN